MNDLSHFYLGISILAKMVGLLLGQLKESNCYNMINSEVLDVRFKLLGIKKSYWDRV